MWSMKRLSVYERVPSRAAQDSELQSKANFKSTDSRSGPDWLLMYILELDVLNLDYNFS